MAKKNFNDLLEERRAEERKKNGTETAKELLSAKTKGEHREGYKETTFKIRLRAEEKELWQEAAKADNYKPLSVFIREAVNEKINREKK